MERASLHHAPCKLQIPLNSADDQGGSWVTFSPPGSPQGLRSPIEGAASQPTDELAREAARRLEALSEQPAGADVVQEEEASEQDDGLADLAELIGEM